MFEEARRLARSLRNVDDWEPAPYTLKHVPTGWALWIGSGVWFVQPYVHVPKNKRLPSGRVPRYGVIEKLIIWYGGARRWARMIERESIRQARFEGEA